MSYNLIMIDIKNMLVLKINHFSIFKIFQQIKFSIFLKK